MSQSLEYNLQQLRQQPEFKQLYYTIQRGVEKEALRVTPKGLIAQTSHPKGLGATLTHPYITTDYSEGLLEFITPPLTQPNAVLEWLEILHYFTYQNIGDEILWANSMPCQLTTDKAIPIALYGNSNIGKMKHIYRRGLAYRYGKTMQTIAGMHVNLSFPQEFWQLLQSIKHDKQPLQSFIDQHYLALIRNFLRYHWLTIYLFGASPALSQSFKHNQCFKLDTIDNHTYYKPYATSLRMSDIGYKNEAQSDLHISYNSLQEYIDALKHETSTSDPRYQKFGIKVDGEYRQLNASILQIEAEHYGPIRPKRTSQSGERPTSALQSRGVEYIELRGIDINPFHPVGIEAEDILFLEVFLLFCVLDDSPIFNQTSQQEINLNLKKMVDTGRTPDVMLQKDGQPITFKSWATTIMQSLHKIADALDKTLPERPYRSAIENKQRLLAHPEELASAQILQALFEQHHSFLDFAMSKSKQHRDYFNNKGFPKQQLEQLKQIAKKSLEDQHQLESADTLDLDSYIQQYFS